MTEMRAKVKIYRHRWDKGEEALKEFEARVAALVDVIKSPENGPPKLTWFSDKSSIIAIVEWTMPS